MSFSMLILSPPVCAAVTTSNEYHLSESAFKKISTALTNAVNEFFSTQLDEILTLSNIHSTKLFKLVKHQLYSFATHLAE
jgi:hypothetical protein